MFLFQVLGMNLVFAVPYTIAPTEEVTFSADLQPD